MLRIVTLWADNIRPYAIPGKYCEHTTSVVIPSKRSASRLRPQARASEQPPKAALSESLIFAVSTVLCRDSVRRSFDSGLCPSLRMTGLCKTGSRQTGGHKVRPYIPNGRCCDMDVGASIARPAVGWYDFALVPANPENPTARADDIRPYASGLLLSMKGVFYEYF